MTTMRRLLTSVPSTHRASLMLAAVLLSLHVPAQAQVERLDDSTSPRAQIGADLRDAQSADGRELRLSLGRIDYRLDTRRYVGRTARIYLVIPAAVAGLRNPSGVAFEWRSNGAFASGTGHPGQRVQVWSGVVRDVWTHETLELTLRIVPGALRLPERASLRLETYFEIETLP